MRSLITWIIVILLTIYVGLIYGSTAIIALGFAEGFFVVLSFTFLMVVKNHMELKLVIPQALAAQNQTMRIMVENQTKDKLKPGKVKYQIWVFNPLTGKKQKKWLTADMDYFYTLEDPGRYEFELKKAKLYDWSGLFSVSKPIRQTRQVQVNPDIYSVPVHVGSQVRNFFGEADVYDDFRPGYDAAELFSVRNFQNGDRIQRIHWKLSAKTEDLLVKENHLPKACGVTIIANAMSKKKGRMGKRKHKVSHKERLSFIQLVTGLSYSLMDQGCPHYVAWYSNQEKDIVRARVEDEEGFYLFLTYFLENTMNTKIDARKLYQERFQGESLIHQLEVQSDLTLLMDQSYEHRLSSRYLEVEMGKMELEL